MRLPVSPARWMPGPDLLDLPVFQIAPVSMCLLSESPLGIPQVRKNCTSLDMPDFLARFADFLDRCSSGDVANVLSAGRNHCRAAQRRH